MTVNDSSGTELRLGTSKFEGGEGTIFQHPSKADFLVKIYKKPSPERAAKVEALIKLGTQAPEKLREITAWPIDRVIEKAAANRGSTVGFVMRKLSGEAVHSIYSPKERKLDYPDFTWANLVHVAKNIAAAFYYVHSTGAVMGDVNEQNFLVDAKTGKTFLIDCDSYQVTYNARTFRCPVGVLQWTPPELQGVNFQQIDRTANHDRFGLAVLIFQLLFGGRHPFSSQTETDMEKAIRSRHFAYSDAAKALGAKPPASALENKDVTSDVFAMFERAFFAGASHGSFIGECEKCQQKNRIQRNNPRPICGKCQELFPDDWNDSRPKAEKWFHALDAMAKQIVPCTSNPLHYHLPGQRCAFCRLDEAGTPLFNLRGNISANVDLSPDAAVVRLILQIRDIPLPQPPALIAPNPVAGKPVPARISKMSPAFAVGLIFFSLGAFFALFAAWAVAGGFGFVGIVCLAQGRYSKEFRMIRDLRLADLSSFQIVVNDLKANLGKFVADRGAEINGLKSEAEKCYQALLGIPARQKEELKKLDGQRRDSQLEDFMDRFLITHQKIRGLGPKRRAALQTLGIETAWDLRGSWPPPRIPEDVWDELKKWRKTVEAQFRFDPSRPLPGQAVTALNLRLRHERANLQNRIHQIHNQLAVVQRDAPQTISSLREQLEQNLQLLKQAEADWQVVEK